MDPIPKYNQETGYKNAQITLWKIQNDINCIAESVRNEIREINIIP